MKNHTLLKTITILIVIITFFAAAIIIAEVIIGYSGFKGVNGNDSAITVASGCQQQYINTRLEDALGVGLQTCFICAVVSLMDSTVCLCFIACFIYCRRSLSEEREETRIQDLQSHYYEQREAMERFHAKITEIVPMYVFLSLLIISAYVPFNFYLQLMLQSRQSSCQIDFNQVYVLVIDILSLVILVLSLIAFILLLVISYRYSQRMKMLELENGSESYRQQVNRIIREMPESERRFYQEQHRHPKTDPNQEDPHQRMVREHSDSHKSEIKIEHVPQVQSILYKAQPELMLQSVNGHH